MSGAEPAPAWGAESSVVAACEALATRTEPMLARLQAWVDVNSGSLEPDGLARMAALIEPALAALPGAVERLPLAPTPRVRADGQMIAVEHGEALRLRVRPEAPIQIALTGHYDTVFPAASPFQHFVRRDDGAIVGPGVADMKGGIVVMLEALAAFERTTFADRIGYEVLLSPDEEIGSPASAPLLAELGARADVGMTYEPALASGALVDARKGSANYHLIITGRAAHVGRDFAAGRSAVVAAAEAVMRLDALNGQREGVTFNVGAIDGGAPVNMVPPGAVLRFNVRAPDGEAALWAEREVAEIVAAAAARDGIEIRLHGGFTRPPKPVTPPQAQLIAWTKAAGRDLGLDLAFQPSGGVCEGNNLAAAGCPNIDTLGPCGGGLHSVDEFARIDSFAQRAQLSLVLLAGFASGRFDIAALKP
jgi:glutamate carboxypeptidase